MSGHATRDALRDLVEVVERCDLTYVDEEAIAPIIERAKAVLDAPPWVGHGRRACVVCGTHWHSDGGATDVYEWCPRCGTPAPGPG